MGDYRVTPDKTSTPDSFTSLPPMDLIGNAVGFIDDDDDCDDMFNTFRESLSRKPNPGFASSGSVTADEFGSNSVERIDRSFEAMKIGTKKKQDGGSKKRRNLRDLIEQVRKNQSLSIDDGEDPARSDDSFYSEAKKEKIGDKKWGSPNLAECRDLISSLCGKKSSVVDKLGNVERLLMADATSMGESMFVSPLGVNFDIFSACDSLLSDFRATESPVSEKCLRLFLKFFADVLSVASTGPVDNFNTRRLICDRTSASLFASLLQVLDQNLDHVDLLNHVAKVVYLIVNKDHVVNYMGRNEQWMLCLVEKLHLAGKKYMVMCSARILRCVFEHKDSNPSTVNDDLAANVKLCEWMVAILKRKPSDDDALYVLYYAFNRMPKGMLNRVLSEEVAGILQGIADDAATADSQKVIATKILQFPKSGNFLDEKIKRNIVMAPDKLRNLYPDRSRNLAAVNGRPKFPAGGNGHLPDVKKPIQQSVPKGAVLMSITELRSKAPYLANSETKAVNDRRLELVSYEQSKATNFRYGQIFNTNNFKSGGYKVAIVADTRRRDIVATSLCTILNSNKAGVLFIGIVPNADQDAHVVQGVRLDRKERDHFRQGMDCVLQDFVNPSPYNRLSAPIFNPVLHHPQSPPSGETEHFVVSIEVSPSESSQEYKVRAVEYVRHRGETYCELK